MIKKIAFVKRLHKENIGVACLQESIPERMAAFQHQGISGV